MKKSYKFIVIVFILSIFFSYLSYYFIMEDKAELVDYPSLEGQVDLSSVDFSEEMVRLKGEWIYYDRQVLSQINPATGAYRLIPENQKTSKDQDFYRYGSYLLEVEGLEPNTYYEIYSDSQVSAFNLYVNNIKVIQNGHVSETKEDQVSMWKQKHASFLTDEEGRARLVYEISNYQYADGLMWSAPIIGNHDNIDSWINSKILIDGVLIFIFISGGSLLLCGYGYFRVNKSVLYFALLSIDMGIRLSVTSSRILMQINRGLPWEQMIRIEYISGYLLLPIMLGLIWSLLKIKAFKYINSFIFSLMLTIALLVSFMPINVFMKVLDIYLLSIALFLMVCTILVVRHFKHNRLVLFIIMAIILDFGMSVVGHILGSQISYAPISVLNALIGFSIIIADEILIDLHEKDLVAKNAMIDPLTGLYNRQYLKIIQKEFQSYVEGIDPYMLFLDLDGFKKVNDRYGHEAGDEVLQIVGRRINRCLRVEDQLIRYGGDEFIIVAYASDDSEINELCDRIISGIKNPIKNAGHLHELGVSIGVSRCHDKINNRVMHCVHECDKAMYIAKQSGGNQYYHMKIELSNS